jgi:hypothetical protein
MLHHCSAVNPDAEASGSRLHCTHACESDTGLPVPILSRGMSLFYCPRPRSLRLRPPERMSRRLCTALAVIRRTLSAHRNVEPH